MTARFRGVGRLCRLASSRLSRAALAERPAASICLARGAGLLGATPAVRPAAVRAAPRAAHARLLSTTSEAPALGRAYADLVVGALCPIGGDLWVRGSPGAPA